MDIIEADYAYVCAVRNLPHASGRICSGPAPLKCLGCAARTYTADDAGNAILGRSDAPVRWRNRLRGTGKGLVAVSSILFGRPLVHRHLGGVHS